jgi:hypothetical protein
VAGPRRSMRSWPSSAPREHQHDSVNAAAGFDTTSTRHAPPGGRFVADDVDGSRPLKPRRRETHHPDTDVSQPQSDWNGLLDESGIEATWLTHQCLIAGGVIWDGAQMFVPTVWREKRLAAAAPMMIAAEITATCRVLRFMENDHAPVVASRVVRQHWRLSSVVGPARSASMNGIRDTGERPGRLLTPENDSPIRACASGRT